VLSADKVHVAKVLKEGVGPPAEEVFDVFFIKASGPEEAACSYVDRVSSEAFEVCGIFDGV
jgi:hypothetical protein